MLPSGKWGYSHNLIGKQNGLKWKEIQYDITFPSLQEGIPVGKSIANARVYVTSHGFYELHLNGKKAGDQVLTGLDFLWKKTSIPGV